MVQSCKLWVAMSYLYHATTLCRLFVSYVRDLQALTALDLSYNQLTRIPEQIGSLSRLETLDVSYNHLTSIPDQVRTYAHTHTHTTFMQGVYGSPMPQS